MKTQYVVNRPVHNAYLVRERDRQRWRHVGQVLLCVLPLSAALVSYTWIHLEVIEAGYRIHEMEGALESLADQRRRLEMEASRLKSPSRLEAIAVEHGLRVPDFKQLVFVANPL